MFLNEVDFKSYFYYRITAEHILTLRTISIELHQKIYFDEWHDTFLLSKWRHSCQLLQSVNRYFLNAQRRLNSTKVYFG